MVIIKVIFGIYFSGITGYELYTNKYFSWFVAGGVGVFGGTANFLVGITPLINLAFCLERKVTEVFKSKNSQQ